MQELTGRPLQIALDIECRTIAPAKRTKYLRLWSAAGIFGHPEWLPERWTVGGAVLDLPDGTTAIDDEHPDAAAWRERLGETPDVDMLLDAGGGQSWVGFTLPDGGRVVYQTPTFDPQRGGEFRLVGDAAGWPQTVAVSPA
jgi:hypothetical protein